MNWIKAIYATYYSYAVVLMKSALTVCLLYLLYHQLFVQNPFHQLSAQFQMGWLTGEAFWVFLAVLLMPVNWFLETLKWRQLTQHFFKDSWHRSLKVICAGITCGWITPSRIGEYGGRAWMVNAENRRIAIGATLVSSLAQNISIFIFGLAGIFIIQRILRIWPGDWSIMLLMISIPFVLMLLFLYSNLIALMSAIERYLPGFVRKRKCKLDEILSEQFHSNLKSVLLLSGFRYIIYTLQYVFLLYFMGIDAGWWHNLCIISVVWLVQTGIPLPPVLGIIGRGEISVWLWSVYTDNVLGILMVTFLLWMINLLLPAVAGWYFLMKEKRSVDE
ncbi:MAG TPA: hypothetical protein PKC30_02450 [Saprospiraceae bacterium]|nr:hypothetical protein [Saprospiraceae bacterium]